MKKAVFITVRTDSSRLPNKAVLHFLGKPIIELIALRTKLVRGVDEVVLCTTERPIDDELVNIAERTGIKYFRGNLNDKLERWLGAARQFNIDCFATMDGDDPLGDPELVEVAINQMEIDNRDFIRAPKGMICGAFTYCIRTSALEKVCAIKGTDETEMMWVYFEDTGLFRVADLDVTDPIFFDDGIRLTLDYPEDFRFFTTIFEHFGCKDNDVPLREIVPFLRLHPEICHINAYRQKDFIENQKRKTKLIVKGVEALYK